MEYKAGRKLNVAPNLLSAQVIEKLEELIFHGGLEPGSSLPSESELIERFGVSRVVIREAIRSLEARGLVLVRQGKRPTIIGLGSAIPRDFFRMALYRDRNAFLELIEVRRALEVHISRLAAIHATEADIKGLQDTVNVMKAIVNDLPEFSKADLSFHRKLAAASDNWLLRQLMEALDEPLQALRVESRLGRSVRGLSFSYTIVAHQNVLDKIIAKDPEGAAKAMEVHLDETLKDLQIAHMSEGRQIQGEIK